MRLTRTFTKGFTDRTCDCVATKYKNIPLLEGNEIKIFEIGNVFSKNEERASLGIGYSENSKFINDTINKLSGFLCVKINGETTKIF